MSGFYLDAGELRALAERLGATPAQMTGAYNRALRGTLAKYRREALALMMEQTGGKDKKALQRRVKTFSQRLAMTAVAPGQGRLWFGLNPMPVSALRGRMDAPEQPERQRDARGRFVRMNGARGATFTPASPQLATLSFPDSFIGIVRGRESIWQRDGRGFVREATVPVYGPVRRAISDDLFSEMNDELLRRFEQDMKGRIAGGIN
ncbi:hypothetical protein [Pantoea agglomerans]|uniref:hypothetical protein n=1 Tax=Enterobacter agglomerans TaxID=549 RepID=UPI0013BBA009|nr:hypothetical protein [Pantoea agglomerans]NEG58190.1 hypothetical protein [Pantoea agglomerans]NEG99903.1 hypothetical protein [Pantoea agglomerans]NEH04134.1 hypothetical protein [Pantoea agglomerans]NEH14463.1 hypothetical protein [Pantoea agglomerans]